MDSRNLNSDTMGLDNEEMDGDNAADPVYYEVKPEGEDVMKMVLTTWNFIRGCKGMP